MAERRKPDVTVILDRSLKADGIGTLDGNFNELILAELGADGLPELLPIDGLNEAVVDANRLKLGDGHIAVTLEDGLHEIGRLVLKHRLERGGIGLTHDEHMIPRRDFEHVDGGVVRELVAALRLEVDGNLAVKVIETFNRA